jgi:hypothetical protein
VLQERNVRGERSKINDSVCDPSEHQHDDRFHSKNEAVVKSGGQTRVENSVIFFKSKNFKNFGFLKFGFRNALVNFAAWRPGKPAQDSSDKKMDR